MKCISARRYRRVYFTPNKTESDTQLEENARCVPVKFGFNLVSIRSGRAYLNARVQRILVFRDNYFNGRVVILFRRTEPYLVFPPESNSRVQRFNDTDEKTMSFPRTYEKNPRKIRKTTRGQLGGSNDGK